MDAAVVLVLVVVEVPVLVLLVVVTPIAIEEVAVLGLFVEADAAVRGLLNDTTFADVEDDEVVTVDNNLFDGFPFWPV